MTRNEKILIFLFLLLATMGSVIIRAQGFAQADNSEAAPSRFIVTWAGEFEYMDHSAVRAMLVYDCNTQAQYLALEGFGMVRLDGPDLVR